MSLPRKRKSNNPTRISQHSCLNTPFTFSRSSNKRTSSCLSSNSSSTQVSFSLIPTIDTCYKPKFIRESTMPPVSALFHRQIQGHSFAQAPQVSQRFYIKDFVSTEKDVYKFMSENNTAAPPFGCTFNNIESNGRLLAVADEEGRVNILDTSFDNSIENERTRISWHAHNNAVFDVQWTHDDKRVITVSGDQTAGLWDVETRKCLGNFYGHTSSVKSVTINPFDNHIFATASRDGNVMIWDTRCSGSLLNSGEYRHRPVDIIKHAHSLNFVPPSPKRRKVGTNFTNDTSHSVTAVQFLTHAPSLLSSAGAADGLVKIWDTRKHGSHSLKPYITPVATSLHKGPTKRAHGISSLALDPMGHRIFAASTNNQISMYSTTSLGSPIATFNSSTYKCSSFYVKIALSPDTKFLVSGSSDKNLYIWEVDSPKKAPLILKAHENEVTSVSWSNNDIEHLASCSDDRTVRLWNINRSFAEACRSDERLASANGLAHDS
ncbi:hypothetical protein K7432_004711 [Basidiobolus ranarum]|uniref:Uncharacterized protein n=1 Tax=Basidiobolus ranarum TaxID=34480 RepID=A0ABR2W556_9FUNG